MRIGVKVVILAKISENCVTFYQIDYRPGHLVIGEVLDLLSVRGRGGDLHGCDSGGGHLCLSK